MMHLAPDIGFHQEIRTNGCAQILVIDSIRIRYT